MEEGQTYSELGFRCGLEIHQRLATKTKLFCSCDAQLQEDTSISEVERKQRAVAGELGRIDPAAAFEASKGRKFIYNLFKSTTCLVDSDEEPPHSLNREAVDIALQIAAALNAEVPSELEPMRKVVVDGSDPSAFQRTLLIGHSGHLQLGNRRINISGMFLEEESSGIEHTDNDVVIYNVDRIGIPLIEIDTDPEIKTPKEAKEVARRIGLILRLTGRVQRGIGSTRQDVNVSISNGARVEIKGFQELETMDKIIENEVHRQLKLLEVRQMLQERHAKVHAPMDVSSIFFETKAKLIKKSLDQKGAVFALRLQGFGGILGHEINPDRRVGSEISDYAKLAGVGGIIHSDEDLVAYGIYEDEVSSLRNMLDIKEGDAFVIVAGPRGMSENAIGFAKLRAEYALEGVPAETRGVNSRALTTNFLRPLPGGARMYPETDVRPLEMDDARYEKLKGEAINVDEITQKLQSQIKNEQLAEQMLWSPYLGLFSKIVKETGVDGSTVAPILLEKTRNLSREGINVEGIKEEAMLYMFEKYKKGKITKAGIEEIMRNVPANPKEVDKIVKSEKLERLSRNALRKLIRSLGKEKKKEEVIREIMSKYRLKVDGEELHALIK